jgi:hypothetical protein
MHATAQDNPRHSIVHRNIQCWRNHMNRHTGFAVLAAAIIAAASPALATINGDYTVTYLSGPSHTATATQCLQFTPAKKSDYIIGFPHSGTWTATTFSGYGGNFVEDGSDLRFYGTFNSGAGVIVHHVKGGKGGFDDFAPTSTGATASNDGDVTLVKGCAAASRLPAKSGVSPTH